MQNIKKDNDKKEENRKQATEAVEDYNELKNKYQRALADYQNLLKRTAQEKEEFAKYANEQLLLDMIPVYDNLKTSLKHTDDTVESNGWAEGIRYVVKQFKDTLENLGVREIKTVGEKFDPELMEALGGRGRRVREEVKAGYILNGKVIIPAKVILET